MRATTPLVLCTILFASSATAQQAADTLPAKWPIPMPSAERIAAVRTCPVATAIPSDSATVGTCGRARQLANAIRAIPRGGAAPDSLRLAMMALGHDEPLFLLTNPLLFNSLFGKTHLVEAPPFADVPISRIDIVFEWRGYGDPLNWTATIVPADTMVAVTLKLAGLADSTVLVPASLLRAVGPALTDFYPIKTSPLIQPCFDNIPDWNLTVSFKDGRTVLLSTNQSNDFTSGGPWQMVLEGKRYLQMSTALVVAVGKLAQAAKLPPGRPRAYTCRDPGSMFDQSYPIGG